MKKKIEQKSIRAHCLFVGSKIELENEKFRLLELQSNEFECPQKSVSVHFAAMVIRRKSTQMKMFTNENLYVRMVSTTNIYLNISTIY